MKYRPTAYKPTYPLVEVIWDDAASNSESWVNVKDITEPEQVITVGYLVKKTKTSLTVAASVSNEELHEDIVGNTMTIPRGMIVSFRELKVSTKETPKPRVLPKKRKPRDQRITDEKTLVDSMHGGAGA